MITHKLDKNPCDSSDVTQTGFNYKDVFSTKTKHSMLELSQYILIYLHEKQNNLV